LNADHRTIERASTLRLQAAGVVALLASLVNATALADAIVTYTQNFDTLPSSSTSVSNTGAINLQAPITQISATNATWQAARISGTNTTAVPFNVGTGAGNTGGLYSYATSGSSDRSLGLFASSTTVPAAGLALVNTGTAIVNSVNISFTSEQWRSPNTGGVVNTTSFAYGFSSNTAITDANFLSSSAMVAAEEAMETRSPACCALSRDMSEWSSSSLILIPAKEFSRFRHYTYGSNTR
jgi:hypothetical protein